MFLKKKNSAPFIYTPTSLGRDAESLGGVWVGVGGCRWVWVGGGLAWKIKYIGRYIVVPSARLTLRLSKKKKNFAAYNYKARPKVSACLPTKLWVWV